MEETHQSSSCSQRWNESKQTEPLTTSTTPFTHSTNSSISTNLMQLWSTIRLNWWHQIMPFIFVFIFFIGSMWFNCVLQVMVQRREDIQTSILHDPFDYYRTHHRHKRTDEPVMQPGPQPDLLYQLLPYFTFWIVNDALALGLLAILIGKFLLVSSCSFSMVSKRYMMIQGLLFALRGISINLTGMSVPLTTCESDISEDQPAAVEAWLVMIGFHRTCSDLLFSGHTAFYTIGLFFVWTYGKGEEWFGICGWEERYYRKQRQLELQRASQPRPAAGTRPTDLESQVVTTQTIAPTPTDTAPLLTNEQIRQEAHEIIAQEHPWIIPELNAAGDPSQTRHEPERSRRKQSCLTHPLLLRLIFYSTGTMTLTTFLILIYVLVGYFFLVTTHFHYSVDVFVGILIASTIFYCYHSLLKTLHERRHGWFKSFLTWLEHIPKVGEYVHEESREEQIIQAQIQKQQFQVEAISGVEAEEMIELHTYVVYSLTQNRYILKRVKEIQDIAFVNRQEQKRLEGVKQQRSHISSSGPHPSYGSSLFHSHRHLTPHISPRMTPEELRQRDVAIAQFESAHQYQAYGLEPSPASETSEPFVFRFPDDTEAKQGDTTTISHY